ncbi:helix-turn-helix transcriptional regulator, partial [Gordonibacter sp.]
MDGEQPNDFQKHLAELMQDPDFQEAGEEDKAEHQLRKTIIETRLAIGLTQQQLAQATGMNQRSISRLEMGNT